MVECTGVSTASDMVVVMIFFFGHLNGKKEKARNPEVTL
jgi:hypothetical protein